MRHVFRALLFFLGFSLLPQSSPAIKGPNDSPGNEDPAAKKFDAQAARLFLEFLNERFPEGLREALIKVSPNRKGSEGTEQMEMVATMAAFFTHPKYIEEMGILSRTAMISALSDCLSFIPDDDRRKIKDTLHHQVESWRKFLNDHREIFIAARTSGESLSQTTSRWIVYYWFATLALFVDALDHGEDVDFGDRVLEGGIAISADDFGAFPSGIRELLLIRFVNKNVTAIRLAEKTGLHQKAILGIQNALKSSRSEKINETMAAIERRDIKLLEKLWPKDAFCAKPLKRKRRR
jgi:hypothetical protein